MPSNRSEARLQEALSDVRRLLDRHRLLETIAARQEGPKRDLLEDLQHRQNVAEFQRRLHVMHAADVAFVLEALPPVDRQAVWSQVTPERAAHAFVEVSDAVRPSLVEATAPEALERLLALLDAE